MRLLHERYAEIGYRGLLLCLLSGAVRLNGLELLRGIVGYREPAIRIGHLAMPDPVCCGPNEVQKDVSLRCCAPRIAILHIQTIARATLNFRERP